MKKFLLTLGTLLVASSPVLAQESGDENAENRTVIFTYLGSYSNQYFNHADFSQYPKRFSSPGIEGYSVTALVYFPQEIVEKYAGYKVTSMFAVSGSSTEGEHRNLFIDAQMIFTEEKESRSFHYEKIKFPETAFTWTRFDLEKPVEIEADRPFYAGFAGVLTDQYSAPFVYCGYEADEADGVSSWVQLGPNGWFDMSKTNMKLTKYGPLMIEFVFTKGEGDVEHAVYEGPKGYIADVEEGVFTGSGVEVVTAVDYQATVVDGGLMIQGSFNNAAVYNVSGIKVAEASANTTVNLPAGLYIVNVDGKNAGKYFVK